MHAPTRIYTPVGEQTTSWLPWRRGQRLGRAGEPALPGTIPDLHTSGFVRKQLLHSLSAIPAARNAQESIFCRHHVKLVIWQPGWSNKRSWRGKSDLHLGPEPDVSRSRKSVVWPWQETLVCVARLLPQRREERVGPGWEQAVKASPFEKRKLLGENQPSAARRGGRGWRVSLPAAAVPALGEHHAWPLLMATVGTKDPPERDCDAMTLQQPPLALKGGSPRALYIHSMPAWVLEDFCQKMDCLSDYDWMRFGEGGTAGRVGWQQGRCSAWWWGHTFGTRGGRVWGLAEVGSHPHTGPLARSFPSAQKSTPCRQGIPLHQPVFGIKRNLWLIGGIPDFCVLLASPGQPGSLALLSAIFHAPLSLCALMFCYLPVFTTSLTCASLSCFFLSSLTSCVFPHTYCPYFSRSWPCPVNMYRKRSPWGFFFFFFLYPTPNNSNLDLFLVGLPSFISHDLISFKTSPTLLSKLLTPVKLADLGWARSLLSSDA